MPRIARSVAQGDFNGDGRADFLLADTSNSSRYIENPNTRTNLYQAPPVIPDLLSSLSNGLGGTTTLEYLPSSAYDNCFMINSKDTCVPFVIQTLSSVTTDDGNGNSSVKHYTYSGGYYDYVEREFRGFQNVNSQDCLTYQNNECTPDPEGKQTESWYYQDNIFKGLLYDQITKDQGNYIYTRTLNTYESKHPSYADASVNFPYLKQQDSYVFDGVTQNKEALSSAWHTRISYEYNDDYGNVTSKTYEDVTYPDRGDKKTEYMEYYYDTTNYIVSFPSTKYVTDKDGNTKARDWFRYDLKGNLYRKESWLSAGINPTTTYQYDSYGNIRVITDPNQNPPTIITYDTATQTYPVTTQNPLSHTIQKTYDYRFGKISTETDANLNPTTYDYDTFGRLTKITRPYPYGINEYFYQNFGSVGSQNIREEAKDGNGTLIHFKETYFDGLGRTWEEYSGGPGARTIVVDTEYNNMGLVYRKSLPYYAGDAVYKTAYTYDPIDRLIYTSNPDGTSSSTSYMKGSTTYIDANGHKKVGEKDIYERLIKIEEYTGVSPSFTLYATTTYQYDVLGNLTNVMDANGNETTINYDTLSRKTSMTDPDMGYWVYQYDANGNLISQTDAKNQTIIFTYDALNRITLKDYPTGTDVVYAYDEVASTNPKGRLTTLTDSSGTTKYYYDPAGQTTKTDRIISSTTYTTQTQYDAFGRVKKTTYPDNTEVDYTYDGNGNVKDIKSGAQTYVTYNSYNAFAQPLLATYGNNAATQYQYYAQNNRLFSITTNSQSAGLMNLSYYYDNTGNITRIQDHMDGTKTRDYIYDELDRLTSATSVSYGGALTWQYDNIGNMTYNSRAGNYYYNDPHHIHAVTSAGADTYQYDENGNMISGAGRALTYDYDNRPIHITANGVNVDSVYDANGQRVTKLTPSSTTIYIGQTYECTNGVCTKYILSGTQIIAQVSAAGTYYYHTDHLGSSSVITAGNDVAGKQAGEQIEGIYYYPYGETHTNSGEVNVRYKYTGKELDAEDGLYYYGARYYDPKLARFISADTIVPKPFYPISLNRYAYAYNNPIILKDLDGHYPNEYWSSYYWDNSYYYSNNNYYNYTYSYSSYPSSSYVISSGLINNYPSSRVNNYVDLSDSYRSSSSMLYINNSSINDNIWCSCLSDNSISTYVDSRYGNNESSWYSGNNSINNRDSFDSNQGVIGVRGGVPMVYDSETRQYTLSPYDGSSEAFNRAVGGVLAAHSLALSVALPSIAGYSVFLETGSWFWSGLTYDASTILINTIYDQPSDFPVYRWFVIPDAINPSPVW